MRFVIYTLTFSETSSIRSCQVHLVEAYSHGDPTLLLTVVGMVPFKHYFGPEKPESSGLPLVSGIRTADIENVGQTDRHGTF